MSEELARYENNQISPEDFSAAIAEARDKAKTLKGIVDDQKLSKTFRSGTKPHLMVEAWETIGKAYGLTVGTGDVQLTQNNGAVTGASATAWVYDQSGTIIGRAEGLCLADEPNWQSKAAYALAGMAQTRAAGRALRQVLGWVVVLAGYNPTPADEMPDDPQPFTADLPSDPNDPMLCPIHHEVWRQSAKQKEYGRGYSHRTETGYCELSDYVDGALETLAFERGMKESEITEIRVSLFGDTAFDALEAHQKLALVAAARQAAAGTTGTTEDF
jgi:hypothetical protein